MSVILTDTNLIPAQRAADEHPSWCDPLHCATYPDTADELLVVHRAVLLDEPGEGFAHGRLVVDVIRADSICARGGELLDQNPAAVRIRGVHEDDEFNPAQASRLAAAVARAAEIAGGAR